MGNNKINVSSSCSATVQNILNVHRRSCDLDLFLLHKSMGLPQERSVLFSSHHFKKDVDSLERHQGKVHEESEIWRALW